MIHLEMFLKIICPNWLASISDHIPFIKSHEISSIKNEMAQKNIGIIHDGTTRFGEALTIVARFVDD